MQEQDARSDQDLAFGNALSESAGGRLSRRAEAKRLIVDMREFMSHLPAVLHQQGLEIVPVTLEVRHCLEDFMLSCLPGACSAVLHQRGPGMSLGGQALHTSKEHSSLPHLKQQPGGAGHRARRPGGQAHAA